MITDVYFAPHVDFLAGQQGAMQGQPQNSPALPPQNEGKGKDESLKLELDLNGYVFCLHPGLVDRGL